MIPHVDAASLYIVGKITIENRHGPLILKKNKIKVKFDR